jgi:DNA-binding response OmpR family regulator
MLSELLTLSGIKCKGADSAAEAWRLLLSERFDLYLLDAWLPEIDGFEFCRQLRVADSATPILFYSGAAYDSDIQKGLAAGANAYMVKPEVDGLVEMISQLITAARAAPLNLSSAAVRSLRGANRQAAFSGPAPVGA